MAMPRLTCLTLVATAGFFSTRARLRALMQALGAATVPEPALQACWTAIINSADLSDALMTLAVACDVDVPLTDTQLLDAIEQPELPLAARLMSYGLAPVEVLRRARAISVECNDKNYHYSLASEERLRALCLELNAMSDGEEEVTAALGRAIPYLEWSNTTSAMRRLRADLLLALDAARRRERLAARISRLALLHSGALAMVERAHQRLSGGAASTNPHDIHTALSGAIQAAVAGGRTPEELWHTSMKAQQVRQALGEPAIQDEVVLAARVVELTKQALDTLDIELQMR
jgi:hypothetical protein